MPKLFCFIFLIFASINIYALERELTERELAAKNIVDAVNAKDSEQYAQDLSKNVVVTMHDGKTVLKGLQEIKDNRRRHFELHPGAKNELVHIVEIDNRVIMHDLVWLTPEQVEPANIVEIFTFDGDKITRIDVIQAVDLNIQRE